MARKRNPARDNAVYRFARPDDRCKHKRTIAKQNISIKEGSEVRVLIFSVCRECKEKTCINMLTQDEYKELYSK